jgi:prophage maintenance system killer protein
VASEIDRLIAMHKEHQQKDVPPEIEAAWLHHRFAQIHPFQDGNGRVVRALASLVFLRAGWFPLVVNRDERVEYIESLEKADQGDLASLVKLFARIQNKAFNQALNLSEQVILAGDPLQQIIAAATERLKERKQVSSGQFTLSHQLEEFTERKLSNEAAKLREALKSADPNYSAGVVRSVERTAAAYVGEAGTISRKMGYQGNWGSHLAWCVLNISERRDSHIVVSFHSMGADDLGLMMVLAWINIIGSSLPITPLSKTLFQFSLQDDEAQVKQRLDKWLDDVLLVGLDLWRKQL